MRWVYDWMSNDEGLAFWGCRQIEDLSVRKVFNSERVSEESYCVIIQGSDVRFMDPGGIMREVWSTTRDDAAVEKQYIYIYERV